MTKVNTASANGVSMASHRQLKVKCGWYDYQARQTLKQQSTIAEISLKGKWLADAGFTVDSKVDVCIEDGRLVITST